MKGQWIGVYGGDQTGKIIINIEDLGDHFQCVAITHPDDDKLPASATFFETTNKDPKISSNASIAAINPFNNNIMASPIEFQKIYPGFNNSTKAIITGQYEDNELSLNAKTDIGVNLNCHIKRKPFSIFSEVPVKGMTWGEFKIHFNTNSQTKCLFRGQEAPWKLRTAFHRRGRYNLYRFMNNDIPILHRRLTANTKHLFNLTNPEENGAFYNLAQHHGYPTPLLDWTYSPYVAAFFAFWKIRKGLSDYNWAVRIYRFDQEKWKNDFNQLVTLNATKPHLSTLDCLAIENDRLVPQQATTTMTNIDDIEAYIKTREDEKRYTYLSAIDIPAGERNEVMKELAFMGITAGSLFPDLDGACAELREALFDQ
ncbi:MAG: FRG domain-containing protein [Endomicrobiales bacterium]|jgi:hypothetical protein